MKICENAVGKLALVQNIFSRCTHKGFLRLSDCQFVTVEEAGWVFSGPWKFKMSVILYIITYLAVKSVGRLKVCSLLRFQLL